MYNKLMKIIVSNQNSAYKKILFLHGTKTSYDSQWMEAVSLVLDGQPLEIIRPEFPEIYKENSEDNDQTLNLLGSIRELIEENNWGDDLIVMGKSLGAKVAVELAREIKVKKLILLGYPLTFQTGELREKRLKNINELEVPIYIIQGEQDKYGRRTIIDKLDYESHINLQWIPDVDHNYFIPDNSVVSARHMNILKQYLISIFQD